MCPGKDSNFHGQKGHQALNLTRLPIPPPGQTSAKLVLFLEFYVTKVEKYVLIVIFYLNNYHFCFINKLVMSDKKKTDLESLGEFGLIDKLSRDINIKNDSTIKGIGDDAAILKHANEMVVTSDILTEGVHFDLVYTPLMHLGYKSVVVNLSDICAMNAIPSQIIVSIAISSKFDLPEVEELYKGIKFAAEKYNVDIVGGDTTSSLTGLTISITAIGYKDEESLTGRDGAQNTNLLCVSGDLGASFVGLQLLEREKEVFEKTKVDNPDFGGAEYLLERILKPEPRLDILSLIRKHKLKPTSMIDVSDGLSSEVLHLCKNSGVGCNIYQEKLPIAQQTWDFAEELNIEPTVCALNGGEDYELLFSLPLSDFDKIKEISEIKVIGHFTEKAEGVNLITKGNSVVKLTAQGWDTFDS